MNSKFSWSRVWQLLRTDVIGNPRYYSRHALSLLLAQVLMIVLPNISVLFADEMLDAYTRNTLCEAASAMLVLGFYIYIFLVVSAVCRPMRSKMQRTTVLAIPASMGEKFTARVLLCTIGAVLLYVVLVLISDVLANVIIWVFSTQHLWVGWTTPRFFAQLPLNLDVEVSHVVVDSSMIMQYKVLPIVLIVSFFCFNYAFYLLSSVLFRKVPAVMALFLQIVTAIVLGIIIINLDAFFDFNPICFDASFSLLSYEVVGIVLLLGLTALEVWWAYRLFKGITVIKTRKIGL